jgi:hypothetical protein
LWLVDREKIPAKGITDGDCFGHKKVHPGITTEK